MLSQVVEMASVEPRMLHGSCQPFPCSPSHRALQVLTRQQVALQFAAMHPIAARLPAAAHRTRYDRDGDIQVSIAARFLCKRYMTFGD
jgi:hypothetical protein